MKTHKDILIRILEIIECGDGKEAFVEDLMTNVYLQSITDLIQQLPANQQPAVREQLSENSATPDKIAAILKLHFTGTQMHEALTTAATYAITEYMQSIGPSLSPGQKDTLISFFQTLPPASSASS